jgi:hypothetical protein
MTHYSYRAALRVNVGSQYFISTRLLPGRSAGMLASPESGVTVRLAILSLARARRLRAAMHVIVTCGQPNRPPSRPKG